MDNIKKILIVLIILLFSYILYRLFLKRAILLKEDTKEGFEEPLATQNEKSSLAAVTVAEADLPLKEFVIKASYNSTFTGNFNGDFVTMESLDHVIEKGCRFVDFEVFHINNGAYVSYSTDSTHSTVETENKLLLDNVLARAASTAFSASVTNNTDPLFVHLRIKSHNNDIYKLVAKSIDNALKNKLYSGKITPTTTLKDLLGKVVVIVDKTINKEYYGNISKCGEGESNCYDLTKYVNIDSGSEFLRTYRSDQVLSKNTTPPHVKDDNISTDVNFIQLVLPHLDNKVSGNPESRALIADHGCQIVAYRFYEIDDTLIDYENMFKENKTAFVRLSKAIKYGKK